MADDSARETSVTKMTPAPAPEPDMSAADRLREFEDKTLGVDAPRFAGKIERGIGSLHSRMSSENKTYHANLERAVEAEDRLAAAKAALGKAFAEHEAAIKALDDAAASK